MIRSPGTPPPDRRKPPSRFTRRGVVVAGLAVLGLGAVGGARWFNVAADVGKGQLSAPEVAQQLEAGALTLVDIRRPDEWARTGVPKGALTLDMRRKDFVEALLQQTDGAKDQPIAVICARGVRSRGLSRSLEQAGFTRIIDVPEGMLGSGAGPGWLKRGLPVERP